MTGSLGVLEGFNSMILTMLRTQTVSLKNAKAIRLTRGASIREVNEISGTLISVS